MLIARRHPALQRAAGEKGVMGSYALGVLAVASSILTAGMYLGSARPPAASAPVPAALTPDQAQVWADSDPTFVKRDAESPATKAQQGVEVGKEQPAVYDEPGAISIYTR